MKQSIPAWAVIAVGDTYDVCAAIDPYYAPIQLIDAPEGALQIGPLHPTREKAVREARSLNRVAGVETPYSGEESREERRIKHAAARSIR